MDRHPTSISGSFNTSDKIYVALVGAAPMTSIDALMLSLERFKTILTSDSAKERFETVVRTIKPSINEVNQFIEAVYAQNNPNMSVSMKGYTLIVEVGLDRAEFLESINCGDIEEILKHINAVGTMPGKQTQGQKQRPYTVYPVKYIKGKFIKL